MSQNLPHGLTKANPNILCSADSWQYLDMKGRKAKLRLGNEAEKHNVFVGKQLFTKNLPYIPSSLPNYHELSPVVCWVCCDVLLRQTDTQNYHIQSFRS